MPKYPGIPETSTAQTALAARQQSIQKRQSKFDQKQANREFALDVARAAATGLLGASEQVQGFQSLANQRARDEQDLLNFQAQLGLARQREARETREGAEDIGLRRQAEARMAGETQETAAFRRLVEDRLSREGKQDFTLREIAEARESLQGNRRLDLVAQELGQRKEESAADILIRQAAESRAARQGDKSLSIQEMEAKQRGIDAWLDFQLRQASEARLREQGGRGLDLQERGLDLEKSRDEINALLGQLQEGRLSRATERDFGLRERAATREERESDFEMNYRDALRAASEDQFRQTFGLQRQTEGRLKEQGDKSLGLEKLRADIEKFKAETDRMGGGPGASRSMNPTEADLAKEDIDLVRTSAQLSDAQKDYFVRILASGGPLPPELQQFLLEERALRSVTGAMGAEIGLPPAVAGMAGVPELQADMTDLDRRLVLSRLLGPGIQANNPELIMELGRAAETTGGFPLPLDEPGLRGTYGGGIFGATDRKMEDARKTEAALDVYRRLTSPTGTTGIEFMPERPRQPWGSGPQPGENMLDWILRSNREATVDWTQKLRGR